MVASTFPDALSALLRSDASRPFVTFYDDASGERIELSVATYANWVSKTAGLVQDELDLARGGLVLVDLPTHWLGAVWLGAAWTAGLCVTTDASLLSDADLVVCGPEGVEAYAGRVDVHPVVALSLRPLGGRFTDPVPAGVTDYGAVVLAQPDSFLPYDPPRPADAAWRDATEVVSQAELLTAVEAATVVEPNGRLLTDVNPCARRGLTLLAPLLRQAATIWVAHPAESSWQSRYVAERATTQLRDTDPA